MFIKSLAVILCLSSFSAFSQSRRGAESGGGGGGLCNASGCRTLAQVGLRVDERLSQNFAVSAEVRNEIIRMVNSIDIYFDKETLIRQAIGTPSVFQVVTGSETRNFRSFREEYLQILREQNASAEGLELMAVSTPNNTGMGKTYLLPEFERLDVRGKALILIHEGLIRESGYSVIRALTFDGHFLDQVEAAEQGRTIDNWPFLNVTILKQRLQVSLLIDLIRNTGSIEASDLCDSVPYTLQEFICAISHSNAHGLNGRHPDAAVALGNRSFHMSAWDLNAIRSYLNNSRHPIQRNVARQLKPICDANPGRRLVVAPTQLNGEGHYLVTAICQ